MISFGEIPDELQLLILTDLIYSRDFPSNLQPFSLISRHGHGLAKDQQIWRLAVRAYFPVMETLSRGREYFFKDLFISDPYELFVKTYQSCKRILSEQGLKFSDYVRYIYDDWHDMPAEKKTVLMGLALAVDQNKQFDPALMIDAKNHAVVFCALLGNRSLFMRLMNDNPPPKPEFKRKAFAIASERGFLSISAYLVSNAQGVLDRNTVCEGFVKAAEHGHSDLIKLFLAQPTGQVVTFALPRALKLACTNGHTDVVAQLLKNAFILTNTRCLNDSARCAVKNQNVEVVLLLLQNTAVPRNLLLMLDLLKNAVENKNPNIVKVILMHAQVQFSLITILDLIHKSIFSLDEQTAQCIIECKWGMITTYARRNIFFAAVNAGLTSVVALILDKDPMIFNKDHFTQALRTANANHHQDLFDLLVAKGKFEGGKENEDHQSFAQSLEALSQELSRLSLVPALRVPEEPVPLVGSGYVQRSIQNIEVQTAAARKKTTSRKGW